MDDLLAYETDDSTLPYGETQEYIFCSARVSPFQSDFLKYGYSSIVSRCGSLAAEYNTTTRKMFFVLKDQLGSTIALTDSSGALVQSYAYDVYGSPYVWVDEGDASSGSSSRGSEGSLSESSASGSSSGSIGTGSFVALKDFQGNLHGNDRFFTGREYNTEVTLYYNRARFYSSELGRFISRDPIGMKDDLNLYGYVGENPVNAVDRMGREKKVILDIFQGAVNELAQLKNLSAIKKASRWKDLNV